MSSYSETTLVRGLRFLAEKQASIANNLANVDTASFKRRVAIASPNRMNFESMLREQLPSVNYEERSDLARGVLRETSNRLDVAVDGKAWLQVRDSAGSTYYTRNGQLEINPEGNLVTREGLELLDTAGNAINVAPGNVPPSELSISSNGLVQDPRNGQEFGTIKIAELENPGALRPLGRGLFSDPLEQQATRSGDPLRQGFIEGSNVDPLQELVAMMTVERSFAATQKALTASSRLQENIIANILR